MSSKSALRSKGFQRLAVTAVVGLLGLGAFVRADGPAPSPPGGVTIADDDTGDGQKWGRAGGRTITYNVTSFNSFSALSWGVVSGTAPGAAFDGGINGGGEVLTFDNSNSNLGNGVARWAGSAIRRT